MTGLVRARYTLEFKQEAVRLVRGGQTVSSVAKTLGLSDQTLHNWLKAEAAGGLREITGKVVSAEKMEIARPHYQIEHVRNLPHFGFMLLQRLHATFAGPMP